MTVELTMPALSPTMEKGTLAKWLVAEGDAVKPGDVLAEIETDKATMEFEAIDEGIVTALLVAEGTDEVAVGTVIALLADGAAAVEQTAKPDPAPAPTPAAVPEPKPEPAAPPPHSSASEGSAEGVSPVARRIAAIRAIDLAGINGSGRDGRIIRADIAPPPSTPPAVNGAQAPAPAPAPPPPTPPVSGDRQILPPENVPVETVKLSSMRRTIARRLTESKSSVPHFYLTVRCNLDPLLALRAELNAALSPQGLKLSVNDLMIRALASALQAVPDANVQFGGDVLHRFGRVDIAMAVAIDGGLVTPVIRDAGAMSVSTIARTSRALADKAREGRLVPEDYEGGTVSISNLGMFGIDEMVPVINPPQALILGVAAGIEQPWKVDGQLGLATIMAATASFDHRAIDGAAAARFMQAFRELVEAPMLLCS